MEKISLEKGNKSLLEICVYRNFKFGALAVRFLLDCKKLSLCCLSACANFTNKEDGIGRGSKTRASQQRLAVSLNLYKI